MCTVLLILWSCVVSFFLAGSALKRLCLGKEHSSRNYRFFFTPCPLSIAWASLWLACTGVPRPARTTGGQRPGPLRVPAAFASSHLTHDQSPIGSFSQTGGMSLSLLQARARGETPGPSGLGPPRGRPVLSSRAFLFRSFFFFLFRFLAETFMWVQLRVSTHRWRPTAVSVPCGRRPLT